MTWATSRTRSSAGNDYLPDLDELKTLVMPETKMICINNPNNPTGALMSEAQLQQIVDIARSVDAYILSDEVYRHLTQTDDWCPSIADLYEKGISVSSMSKVFSLAGGRYIIGSPLFDEATLKLPHGKSFSIRTLNNSAENIYVQGAKLNGRRYTKSYLLYDDIMRGGVLELQMGSQPSNWGTRPADRP